MYTCAACIHSQLHTYRVPLNIGGEKHWIDIGVPIKKQSKMWAGSKIKLRGGAILCYIYATAVYLLIV